MGFRRLGNSEPLRTAVDLQVGDLQRFVRLYVRAECDTRFARNFRRAGQVAVQNSPLDNNSRSFDRLQCFHDTRSAFHIRFIGRLLFL